MLRIRISRPGPAARAGGSTGAYQYHQRLLVWAQRGPYQHALLNAMRAIENRVAIARSATSGQSLFIDRFGRRYQMSEIFTEAALVGNVSVAQSGSFYSRNGDLFAYSCLLFSAFCLIVLRMRNRANL